MKRIAAIVIATAAVFVTAIVITLTAGTASVAESAELERKVEENRPELEGKLEEPEPEYTIIEPDTSGIEEFVRPDLLPAIEQICGAYGVCPELIEAIVEAESGGQENVDNTLRCIGLMGVSEYWNADRMERLNVTNLYDGRSNVLVGVDLLAELFADMEDPYEVLNFYGGWEYSAKGNAYIFSVLERAADLERLHGK